MFQRPMGRPRCKHTRSCELEHLATVGTALPYHHLICHTHYWAGTSTFKYIATDSCTPLPRGPLPLPCGPSGYLCTHRRCLAMATAERERGSGTGLRTTVMSRNCAAMWGRATNTTHTCLLKPPPLHARPAWQESVKQGAPVTPGGKV